MFLLDHILILVLYLASGKDTVLMLTTSRTYSFLLAAYMPADMPISV